LKPIHAGLALAVVVLGGVILMRGGPEGGHESPPDGTMPSRPAPDVVLAIRPGNPRPAAGVAATSAAPKLSPLRQELASGKGRKAMYDRLSQASSRTPEEAFVLAELLNGCARREKRPPRTEQARAEDRRKALASISDKDPARDKRIAAYETTQVDRCEGFEDIIVTPEELRALYAKAAEAGDLPARARLVELDYWAPFAAPPGGVHMRGDQLPTMSDEQLATLQGALASNDPTVMMIAARLLSSTMGNLVIGTGPEERPVDSRAFYDAWSLAACDAGMDCGPSHPAIANGCYRLGNCGASDLREYQFYYGNSPQQSQLVVDYQSHIAAAIRSGDWSYFRFLRAPPPPGSVFLYGPGP
jgi:hypothetical protein